MPPSTSSASLSSSLTIALQPTATFVSASNGTVKAQAQAGAENGECKLLGPFALFIQGALGLLALGSLVFKRWRERPQRPLKIWAFDASKQVVGSSLLHLANLFMSMLSSGELTPSPKAGDYQANPCSFYLLNLAIDTTLGVAILICLLRILTHLFLLTSFGQPPESIQSGNYGQPPKAKWWLKQCLIYFLGLFGMKLCVFFIFKLCPWIIEIGDWALRWTEGDERVQVFFVMLFFPLVMNALQYYIIDSFIKDQKPHDHEPIPSDDGMHGTEEEHAGLRQRRSEETDPTFVLDGSDEVEATKDSGRTRAQQDTSTPGQGINSLKGKEGEVSLEEYDPVLDGESSSHGTANSTSPPRPRGNLDTRKE